MRTFKNILLVLSTGYILVYFSERLFWARLRPDDSASEWIINWIAYSLLTFVFLSLISYFRVKNIWGLFLAGSAFGWLVEGLTVQKAYDYIPLSLSFTALAWHALITIWVGWYALRKAFVSSDRFATLKLSTLIGVCYGVWAINWWLEPNEGGFAPLGEFAGYSLAITLLAMLAYWLANWSAVEPFQPARWVTISISGIMVLFFLLVTVPAAPVALGILPVLLGLVYWGLRCHRLTVEEGSWLDEWKDRIPIGRLFSLLALPAAGILVYALALSLDLQLRTNWFLYVITMPLGFIFFGVSLYKSWRNKPAPHGFLKKA